MREGGTSDPEVDSALSRWLSDEFPTFSRMKVDSDPDGELPDDWHGQVFCRILRYFSHSVRMDVSAHFSALDDEEFFVVEGSGWRGRRESDSQVFCHSN